MTLPVIVIVGPTAVGKTELSLTVAQQFDADIINADSMQLYRGMNIGTAKIPANERRGITHHMLDVLDVTQAANVADYQHEARAIINQIHARGKRVVVVGGSGLFVQGLLEDMQFPGSDPDVRQRLNEEATRIGTQAMYERLASIDPEAAANILPTNERRIIRALEVIELTGEAPTTTLAQLPEIVPNIRVGLRRDRDDLDRRIEQRVELMWQQGLIDEVRDLDAQGLRDGLTASKALGYAQVLDYLAGDIQEDEAKLRTVTSTRRYVRRQESWFNRDEWITWFDAASHTLTADVIAHINTRQNA